METSAAYLPIDRLFAIAEGRELLERTRGAAMFADISGFTPLTELLTRVFGPKRGAEELTVYLNGVYDALITEVHRFGGSVIAFSGDAITCWFDGQEPDSSTQSDLLPTLRATAAALAMQEAMKQFVSLQGSGGEQVSLMMKASLATGPVRRFVVGDPQYMFLDVMAGQTLESLANAEHHAGRGEIILDRAAVETLGKHVEIAEWRTDQNTGERFAVLAGVDEKLPGLEKPWRELASDAFTNEQFQSWLIPAVYRLLRAGHGEFLAELRSASAMFLRFGGIDYDRDESAPQKLDTFIRQAQRILARFDGSLLQIALGDKGSYVYAAFGAPIAHEDDVDRAASAALEVQTLPAQLDFLEPLQIGLTYGRMRVGAYGSASRKTYAALGDPVNLSARLMQAAGPGQILANDDFYNKAGAAFVWEELPSLRVKGKRELVTPHRLVRMRNRRTGFSFEARFPLAPVGREEIIAGLNSSLEKIFSPSAGSDLAQEGQIVCLIGEAGMGKGHLTAYFIHQAREKGAGIAVGVCQSVTRNAVYMPWRQIFNSLLDLIDRSESEAIDKLTMDLQTDRPGWALRLPLLGDLLGLPIPDNPTTAAMDSTLRQSSLFSLLVEMLQTWARSRPMVLVVDNAQWMDEASQALLQTLAQQVCGTAPVLIFLTLRPTQTNDKPLFADLASLSNYAEFPLPAMTATEVAAVVEHLLGLPPARLLLEIIQRMARGNPFYVGELLSAMRASGQLVQSDHRMWQVSDELLSLLRRANFVLQVEGQWQLSADAEFSTLQLGLPDSVYGLILSHLDRLPETHKMTLKVSSVIGYTIDLELLTLSHPEKKTKAEIEAEAAYMESEEVMRSEGSTKKMYAFMHHITQEVAYDTLLFAQRQQLHRAVAEALVKHQPDATTQIAYHAYAGEVWPVSLQSNLRAGAQARQLHATQQGIDFYQKALTSSQRLSGEETTRERMQIHLALGELYVSTGQYHEAGEHLQTAMELAEAQADYETQAQACRWYGRAFEQQGEYEQALTWLNRGFTALNGSASLEEAELSLVAGLINVRQGNYDKALELCERSLQVGTKLNDIAVQARTYNLLGIIDLRRSSGSAIEKFEESLRQYKQIGNVYGQATCHNLIANGYFARGELSLADLHYRQSLDMFIQIGHVYNQVLGNNNLGGIAVRQGRLDAALGYYQQALRQLEQIKGSIWVFGALHQNIGNTFLQRSELDQASVELQKAFDYFNQANVRDLLPELYGQFAELHLRKNDLDAAEHEGQRSIELARELTMPREEGHNLRILGEIAMARGDLSQAEEYLLSSYSILRQADDEYESARTQLTLSQLYLLQNKVEEGSKILDQCSAIFERLQASLDLMTVESVRARFQDK
jgi:class 3 adenylate cyclase/tetratricopeptide (TPR) repeat protein